MVSER